MGTNASAGRLENGLREAMGTLGSSQSWLAYLAVCVWFHALWRIRSRRGRTRAIECPSCSKVLTHLCPPIRYRWGGIACFAFSDAGPWGRYGLLRRPW